MHGAWSSVMQKSEQAVTVLVYAWDPYEPAWPAFCHGFHKYWPDCPYPLVFITNQIDPPCGTAVKVGDVNHFYQKMTLAFERIESPFLLFMHEDYWIRRRVSTKCIEDSGLLQSQETKRPFRVRVVLCNRIRTRKGHHEL